MNKRENYISIASRKGYEFVPVEFSMCASLRDKFHEYVAKFEPELDFGSSYRNIPDIVGKVTPPEEFMKYYDVKFKEGTTINHFGVAHEPGSAAAFHMTKMYHPMESFDSVEQIMAYPLPNYDNFSAEKQLAAVKDAHANGLAAMGNMQTTIWECAWYMRSMENLLCDMMSDDPMAEALLDRVTKNSCIRAASYAKSGCDVIFLGDDIGMQKTIMMSENLYCEWLKPRLKKVIDAARAVNPNVIIFYHSCGFVEPFIPHLIEVGVDVLNPIQPETMSFEKLHAEYGDAISFHGTLGTQTVMPFGSPKEVRENVFRNLDIAGEKGGLIVCPSHLLEPEVPVENVLAYIKACHDYKKQ